MNDAEWLDMFNELLDNQEMYKNNGWSYDEAMTWDKWADDIKYGLGTPIEDNVVFSADNGNNEMLKITKDAFYVRGVKVEQGPGEAEAVYKAFKEFMTWAVISRPVEEDTK